MIRRPPRRDDNVSTIALTAESFESTVTENDIVLVDCGAS